MMAKSKGKLYIVSTPLGNLEDITLRALKVLREVDIIAAEDTRRTGKLLEAYEIKKPMISLYDQTERDRGRRLVSRIEKGLNAAYVSDAGTPGISDPGYVLVNEAIDHGIQLIPVPGPAALITALSVSGLPMDSFIFHGFIPSRPGKRRNFLQSIREQDLTLIFYESPHRIVESLSDMREILGNRHMVLTRELTKIHETVLRGSMDDIIGEIGTGPVKGEITLIVSGASREIPPDPKEFIKQKYSRLKGQDLSLRDIVDRIASESKIPRKIIYRTVLDFFSHTETS